MTKVALGDSVGLTARRISAYENEGEMPPDGTLAELAACLRMPVDFFSKPAPVVLDADRVSFRSFARLSARDRDAALAAASIATEVADWLRANFDLPPINLPDLRDLEPELAAAALRATWGLGEMPAPNLVHLVEAHGVSVFSLVDDCTALDAISGWIDGRPYIFLTSHKSPERARWDVSHELGHLLLHVDAPAHGREQEAEADAFARELLLPERGFRSRAPKFPSLADVLERKVFWRVSAMAYIRRMYQLGVVTEWQYKSLTIEASSAGYRRREGDIERETSQLIPKVLELLANEGTTLHDIAEELMITPAELRGLLFSPAVALAGGNRMTDQGHARGHLRLVKPEKAADRSSGAGRGGRRTQRG